MESIIAGLCLLAQDPTAAPAGTRPWWELLADNALGIMIALIFLTAIISTFVAARNRDRCLKKFNRFDVTLIEQSGRAIWGTLRVFSKGLEVIFSAPFTDDGRIYKESFLYYQNELSRMLTVTRYLDEIVDLRQKAHRRLQLHKMARPGPITRLSRRIRNFLNTFRDAIVKSFGVAMSQAQAASKSTVMQTGGKDLTQIGSTLIGEAGNAYEPMLEQYFGREVVVELVNPADPAKKVVEIAGYLGEYSADYLLLVDCRQDIRDEITIPADRHRLLARQIEAALGADAATVSHRGAYPATVTAIGWGDTRRAVDVALSPGEETTITLPEMPPAGETLRLSLQASRTFDVIIPRAVAAVRHRAEFAAQQ
jgi:hypothetical protein